MVPEHQRARSVFRPGSFKKAHRGLVLRAAVSGADPIEMRPGFAAALARIAGNGVRTMIVETANRFARDLMVQEVLLFRRRSAEPI